MTIANIDDMRRIEVRTEDELNRNVIIKLQNEQAVYLSLEEKDANELVLVLKGYFRLMTGQVLPVDQEESSPIEDLAPPYLSLHRVVPEKWSYIYQNHLQTMCFTVQPVYQALNRKTNGLYNTMGRQFKPPLTMGLSLDSNMNSSMMNNNHRTKNDFSSFNKKHSFDLQSVFSMEVLEGNIVETKNDAVLRRVQEMQQLVENSEKYLTEQQELEKANTLSEWQETSVDIESDTETSAGDLCPGKLKHSDSLLLLTKIGHTPNESRQVLSNAAIEILRSETIQSESDNDSLYTPHNSPKHKFLSNVNEGNNNSRLSFGLHSPDTSGTKGEDFKAYLKHIYEMRNNEFATSSDIDNVIDLYVFDPDIIDLTLIPPPVTPDELDCALPSPINIPPQNFADPNDELNNLNLINSDLDLEEFLASVTVPPPAQKVTPAVELTPEEIMSYIIPPPPDLDERSTKSDNSVPADNKTDQYLANKCNDIKIEASSHSSGCNTPIIEYATVDRRGPFSCCIKNKIKSDESPSGIKPPPRRTSDDVPPKLPPKLVPQERQRSQSLTSSAIKSCAFPPKLPPKGEDVHQTSPHLFLPPKKPPLPPVPPLETLRKRKNMSSQSRPNLENKTAGIGSPHLQRHRYLSNEYEKTCCDIQNTAEFLNPTTAVSTPTSPHLGR